jgi:hypothetical protein
LKRLLLIVVILAIAALSANAGNIVPNFDTVPIGWVVDRYDPNSFTNIGPYAGRTNVLGIEINNAQAFNNRPAPYQSSFYNTQGRQFSLVGGIGDILGADLYIPKEWRDESNGSRRSDMWAIMTDGVGVSDYPIVGFTNYGGTPTFRVWDDTAWVNLTDPIHFGDWNSLEMEFTGSAYKYYINGNLAFTDNTINGTTAFQGIIMQAFNFSGDPSIPNAVAGDPLGNYTAYWDNSGGEVPEPGTVLLMSVGLAGLLALKRRRNNTKL